MKYVAKVNLKFKGNLIKAGQEHPEPDQGLVSSGLIEAVADEPASSEGNDAPPPVSDGDQDPEQDGELNEEPAPSASSEEPAPEAVADEPAHGHNHSHKHKKNKHKRG